MSRHERVEEAIRKEVSTIIHDELKDPRIGFITVTRVELTKDLRSAKIFYSVLGKDDEHRKTKLALDSALGYIRKLVAQRINLRIATELIFKEDHSTEYSVKIEEVLNQLKELNGPEKDLRKHKEI
ncbi:MAG: 30S ribosome-binding factor RbfA [Candidatus Omnitrophota bacterium]|nr:30S ribosome-binding factor RbfA [Candidatus Omnitrophota bacterium]